MPTRTYRKWDSMLARCYRPSHPAYRYYGARGVQVCDRWRKSFAAFLADLGEAPPGLWIDRIDRTKGYEPGNVRWVTPKESAQNRTQRGPTVGSLADKARKAGLPYSVVYQRIRIWKWTEERALTTPKREVGPRLFQDHSHLRPMRRKRLGPRAAMRCAK